MTSLTPFLLLVSLWSSLHLIYRFYSTTHKPRHILPTSLTTRQRKSTTFTLAGPYLRIESTAFNASHDTLVQWLYRNRNAYTCRILRAVFDSGIMISLLGMVVALALLAWTFVQLFRRSMAGGLVPQPANIYPHTKRAFDDNYVPPTLAIRAAPDIPIQLMIPGLTLPFSHLPLLICALFFSQAIHEAGHALSAALDGVPLQSLGASLTLLLPTAFVAFPAHTLTTLAPRVRARIAAAGPLLSALLYLILLLPLGRPFFLLGYSDISADGMLVASVSPESPLVSHLPPGALLTALDDFPLGGARESAWTDYLTAPHPPISQGLAWCLDTKWFLDHPHGCCATPPPGAGSEACMIPLRSDESPRCVEASHFLVSTEDVTVRCEWSCADGQTCTRLRGGEQFLRIGVQSSEQDGSLRVVLWRGQREEIHQDVDVTRWRPRLSILPLWLPDVATKVIKYTQTLTLSLFLLNVLPLPRLDGGELMDAVHCHLNSTSSTDVDIEVGLRERSPPPRSPRSRYRNRILRGITIGLLGGCVLLGLYDSIVRRYVQPNG